MVLEKKLNQERKRNLPKVTGLPPFLEDFQMLPKRKSKQTNILLLGSSWVLETARTVRSGLSHQWRVARNRPSDTDLRHK